MASSNYKSTLKLPTEDIAWLRELAEDYGLKGNHILRIELRNAAEDREFVRSLPKHAPKPPRGWDNFQINLPEWLVDIYGGQHQVRHAIYIILKEKRERAQADAAPIRLACIPMDQLAAVAA